MKITDIAYYLGQDRIQATNQEKDLGIHITSRLTFSHHHQVVLAKASQKFGLIKRNCEIIKGERERRTLYLSLIRSNFEHCPQVWRPISNNAIKNFEKLQKRAVKWINKESHMSYDPSVYVEKLRKLELFPMSIKFDYNDISLMHKIVYKNCPIDLPQFMHMYSDADSARPTRLQSKRDQLQIVTSLSPTLEVLKNSFFFRAQRLWNSIPLELRLIENYEAFQAKLTAHLWDSFNLPPEGIT